MKNLGVLRRVSAAAIVLVLFAGLSAVAADLSSGAIPWSAERPLTWADFQANPPLSAGPPAATAGNGTFTKAVIHMHIAWSLSASGACNGVTATAHFVAVTVTNVMEPSLSWKLPAYATPQTLRHEQFHFNLHEVYRRLIAMTLTPLTITQRVSTPDDCTDAAARACATSLNELADATGMAILTRASAACEAYDADTNNGQDTAAQAAWENRITELLANPSAAP
ncbi:MAG: hypothetical protein NTX23_05740 [Candidatus Bipolaricaulota bacterium]|nr:hypothetical protein [Candidatus Bipolaricaulota bacterium]